MRSDCPYFSSCLELFLHRKISSACPRSEGIKCLMLRHQVSPQTGAVKVEYKDSTAIEEVLQS